MVFLRRKWRAGLEFVERHDETPALVAQITRLEAALVAKAKERAPIYALSRKGLMPLGDLEAQLADITGEETVLQAELSRTRNLLTAQDAARASASQAAQMVALLAERVQGENPPWSEKRELVEALVERITVTSSSSSGGGGRNGGAGAPTAPIAAIVFKFGITGHANPKTP